jgi:hypothetical protein
MSLSHQQVLTLASNYRRAYHATPCALPRRLITKLEAIPGWDWWPNKVSWEQSELVDVVRSAQPYLATRVPETEVELKRFGGHIYYCDFCGYASGDMSTIPYVYRATKEIPIKICSECSNITLRPEQYVNWGKVVTEFRAGTLALPATPKAERFVEVLRSHDNDPFSWWKTKAENYGRNPVTLQLKHNKTAVRERHNELVSTGKKAKEAKEAYREWYREAYARSVSEGALGSVRHLIHDYLLGTPPLELRWLAEEVMIPHFEDVYVSRFSPFCVSDWLRGLETMSVASSELSDEDTQVLTEMGVHQTFITIRQAYKLLMRICYDNPEVKGGYAPNSWESVEQVRYALDQWQERANKVMACYPFGHEKHAVDLDQKIWFTPALIQVTYDKEQERKKEKARMAYIYRVQDALKRIRMPLPYAERDEMFTAKGGVGLLELLEGPYGDYLKSCRKLRPTPPPPPERKRGVRTKRYHNPEPREGPKPADPVCADCRQVVSVAQTVWAPEVRWCPKCTKKRLKDGTLGAARKASIEKVA